LKSELLYGHTVILKIVVVVVVMDCNGVTGGLIAVSVYAVVITSVVIVGGVYLFIQKKKVSWDGIHQLLNIILQRRIFVLLLVSTLRYVFKVKNYS
jgi:hypothetical protein